MLSKGRNETHHAGYGWRKATKCVWVVAISRPSALAGPSGGEVLRWVAGEPQLPAMLPLMQALNSKAVTLLGWNWVLILFINQTKHLRGWFSLGFPSTYLFFFFFSQTSCKRFFIFCRLSSQNTSRWIQIPRVKSQQHSFFEGYKLCLKTHWKRSIVHMCDIWYENGNRNINKGFVLFFRYQWRFLNRKRFSLLYIQKEVMLFQIIIGEYLMDVVIE